MKEIKHEEHLNNMARQGTPKLEDQKAALLICKAVVDVIRDVGPQGTPGGHLYNALMHHGCSLEAFERIMSVLLNAGVVTKRGQLYFYNEELKP